MDLIEQWQNETWTKFSYDRVLRYFDMWNGWEDFNEDEIKDHSRVALYDIYCDFKYVACSVKIFDRIFHVMYHDLLHLFMGKHVYSKDLFRDVVEKDCHNDFYKVEQCAVIYFVSTKIKDVEERIEILIKS